MGKDQGVDTGRGPNEVLLAIVYGRPQAAHHDSGKVKGGDPDRAFPAHLRYLEGDSFWGKINVIQMMSTYRVTHQARAGQNGTFVLMSTGGFKQRAVSPCRVFQRDHNIR